MAGQMKDQREILDKLGIEVLNPMQLEAGDAILSSPEVMLLSPTGTGKTLAFLLPIISKLQVELQAVQALIVVPSRELAIQIEQVMRSMGSGFKANAVYGGRAGHKDKVEIKHPPAVLIGTPGRVADHLRNLTFNQSHIKTLVLDEFDKSLEIGFEAEMKEIFTLLPGIAKKILTSATQKVKPPAFVGLKNPVILNFLNNKTPGLTLRTVVSPTSDKLDTLVNLIGHTGNKCGIVFCNLKETIQRVSDGLHKNDIDHGCFYGGLEQIDRERALMKFRNGTYKILVATDLAARGIDVPEMDFIIHFELPPRKVEFIHRNGRTARMHRDGTAYLLKWKNELLPDFVAEAEVEIIKSKSKPVQSTWETLYISGGRKDKISKGDIAGLFFKEGKLQKEELGDIELKQDCAFVAVPKSKSQMIINTLNNSRLKKKKVRISLVK